MSGTADEFRKRSKEDQWRMIQNVLPKPKEETNEDESPSVIIEKIVTEQTQGELEKVLETLGVMLRGYSLRYARPQLYSRTVVPSSTPRLIHLVTAQLGPGFH